MNISNTPIFDSQVVSNALDRQFWKAEHAMGNLQMQPPETFEDYEAMLNAKEAVVSAQFARQQHHILHHHLIKTMITST